MCATGEYGSTPLLCRARIYGSVSSENFPQSRVLLFGAGVLSKGAGTSGVSGNDNSDDDGRGVRLGGSGISDTQLAWVSCGGGNGNAVDVAGIKDSGSKTTVATFARGSGSLSLAV